MSLKNLRSQHDLAQGNRPVGEMENLTGPSFSITGPGVERGLYPFNIPAGSSLHGGPAENQAGRSLVGPAYQGIYGGTSQPSNLDNPYTNGELTPSKYADNLPD